MWEKMDMRLGEGKHAWIALASAWLVSFFAYAQVFCVSPMLIMIKEELTLSYTEAGLLFSIPLLMLSLLAIPGGMLGDRIGVRLAVGVSATLIGLGGFLRGFSTDFLTLFIYTSLQGVGWALTFPNLPKLVRGLFPRRLLGTATGIYSSGFSSGSTVALALTIPMLTLIAGDWHGVFRIWGAMALAVAVLWWILAGKMLQVSVKSSRDSISSVGRKETASPSVWKNRGVWIVALTQFTVSWTFYALMGWLPTFFIHQGLTVDTAALITSVTTLTSIAAFFFIPLISDRLGLRKWPLQLCALVSPFAISALLYVHPALGWLLTAVIGVTVTGVFVLILVLPMELVDADHVGAATGVVLSVGYSGGLIGPVLTGYVRDVTGMFSLAIIVLTVISAITFVLSFIIPETGRRKEVRL
jgi:CP family cyanate transporter-like MFS transporter